MNPNSFKEIAQSSGINWSRQKGNEAFSVAWLDYNNDGWLDLWISGHGYNGSSQQYPDGKYPYLYLNNGDGTFTNLFEEDWRGGTGGDVHGTTWIDLDNDGDLDFLAAGGGKLGDVSGVNTDLLTNKLFINNGGDLEDEAVARNIDNAIARSRSSVWFDGNNDGLLDAVVVTALRDDDQGYTAYFEQQLDGTFVDRTDDVGLDVNESSRYAQLADFTGDGKLDLVIQGTYTSPLNIYDFSSGTGFVEVTDLVPQISDVPADPTFDFADHSSARDSIMADFNNDGRNDIYLTRSRIFTPEPTIFQGSDTVASADLILQGGGEIGISFQTTGLFAFDSFDFNGRDAINAPNGGFDVNNIFIGASGRLATQAELEAIFGSGYDPSLTSGSDACAFCGGNHSGHNHSSAAFELDPSDPTVAGIKSDRTTRGIYIGYEPSTQTWEVRISSDGNEIVRVAVESDEAITNLSEINFTSADPNSLALSDQFLIYDPVSGEYQDVTAAAGLDTPTLSHSAVTADFDNDMDLDIYVANAYPSFNQPNILYENDGQGNFTAVEIAGGAVGREVGAHRLDFEIGQRIAVADYDNDGFVDIFAGSTTAKSPRKTYLGAPSQLFHNEEGINGNTNNWLQIDLQGIQSNRDGIGARVSLTTPDGVTQVREQNGGTHVFAQNSSRLHFGLGQNNTISSLVVQWSSGEVSTLANVGINQILNIVEAFPSIITGDSSNNSLNGTSDKDRIIGNDGDDTLSGGDNNDSLEGGTGNDRLLGEAGNDTLRGEAGRDTLIGSSGNDVLDGGGWSDSLVGGEGTDTIIGGNGNDTLVGGGSNDTLYGGEGNDSVTGGSGNDTITGDTGEDTLVGDAGTDTIDGGADNDSLAGGEDNDLLSGGDGNDTLRGNNGKDILFGEAGNDNLNGNLGNDSLYGGEGDDSIIGEGGADFVAGDAGNDTIRGSNGDDTLDGGADSDRLIEFNNSDFILTDTQLIARGTDSISNFETARLVAGNGDNLLDATSVTTMNVSLEGGGGNDTIFGGEGDDYLFGLNGADSAVGGAGDDTIRGGDDNDTLDGGAGSDRLLEAVNGNISLTDTQLVARGTDTISNFEIARLSGGTSDNFIDAASVTTMEVILEGLAGNDTLIGGSLNDTLKGLNNDDSLVGNDGNDSLIGGNGNDTLVGGNGNDTIFGGSGTDLVMAEGDSNFTLTNTGLTSSVTGTDSLGGIEQALITVTGTSDRSLLAGGTNIKVTLQGALGNDTIIGGGKNDFLVGNDGNDNLKGNNGNDELLGGAGNDTITGGNGNDTMFGGSGSDRLFESINSNFLLTDTQLIARGADTIDGFETANLVGGENNNTIDASAVTTMNLTLNGNGGNDTIVGGANQDFITGGTGSDVLIGGGGSDRFIFRNLSELGDTIGDFAPGADRINISASGFGGGLSFNQLLSESQFTIGTSATDSEDRFIYNDANGTLFFDADGNGSGSQVTVANLSNSPTINNKDIFIIV